MSFRHLAPIGWIVFACGVAFFSLLLLRDPSRALISSTLNTGLTLASACLVVAWFQRLPRLDGPPSGYRDFTPLLVILLMIGVPVAVNWLSETLLPTSNPAVGALVGHLLIITIVIAIGWLRGLRLPNLVGPLPATRAKWFDLVLTIPLLMLSWGELAFVLNLSAWHNPAATAAEIGDDMLSESLILMLQSFIGVLTITLIGPLSEELLFRGALQRNLAARHGAWFGVSGAAALFALIHLDFFTILSNFILGLVAGLSLVRSGSLLLPILIHALHNFGSYLLLQHPAFQITSLEQVAAWRLPSLLLITVSLLWLGFSLRAQLHERHMALNLGSGT